MRGMSLPVGRGIASILSPARLDALRAFPQLLDSDEGRWRNHLPDNVADRLTRGLTTHVLIEGDHLSRNEQLLPLLIACAYDRVDAREIDALVGFEASAKSLQDRVRTIIAREGRISVRPHLNVDGVRHRELNAPPIVVHARHRKGNIRRGCSYERS